MAEPPRSSASQDPGRRLVISPAVGIPLDELIVRASHSSGPGGQHVNTSDTRVEVRFDVAHSPSLPDEVRGRLLENLSGRLSRGGFLRVVAQGHRSQLRNREDAMARLAALLTRALEEEPPRVPTRPTAGARIRRRQEKQQRGALKRSRTFVDED